jgi:ATP-dependent Lon protease
MEIIRLAGYTEDEKTKIAKRHLIPKQLEAHGLKNSEWSISDGALRELIRHYTREAGVRNLEREIALLARKAIRDILRSERTSVRVTRRTVKKWLGIGRFHFGEVGHADLVGVSTGLAWTEVGGELLTVEAVVMPGRGKVIHTGNLGEVMRESVQAAWSYVRSRSIEFGIAPTVFEQRDIHVHVPEGAMPKEGPSAGVAMCTSMVSALTGIPVRKDVAMTGEITLRGRVLPIGGLKEKLLAAVRGGFTKVLIPKDNERDLAEIPGNVKRALEIIPVTSVDEVIALALTSTPIEWVESGVDEVPGSLAKKDVNVISTH